MISSSSCYPLLVFESTRFDQLICAAGVRSEAEITKRSVWDLFKAAPESEVGTFFKMTQTSILMPGATLASGREQETHVHMMYTRPGVRHDEALSLTLKRPRYALTDATIL